MHLHSIEVALQGGPVPPRFISIKWGGTSAPLNSQGVFIFLYRHVYWYMCKITYIHVHTYIYIYAHIFPHGPKGCFFLPGFRVARQQFFGYMILCHMLGCLGCKTSTVHTMRWRIYGDIWKWLDGPKGSSPATCFRKDDIDMHLDPGLLFWWVDRLTFHFKGLYVISSNKFHLGCR